MEQMMPLLMMSQMGGAGGQSNGETPTGGPDMMDMMMRMMFPEMFEEETIPMWSSASAFGTRRRGGQDEIGVLELRLVPPTVTSPRASLRLICGGVPVLLRPDELKGIESFFASVNGAGKQKAMFPDGTIHEGTLEEIWGEAQKLEDEKKSERLIAGMVKGS